MVRYGSEVLSRAVVPVAICPPLFLMVTRMLSLSPGSRDVIVVAAGQPDQ